MAQTVMVQVLVQLDTVVGIFRDALYYAPAVFNTLSQAQIDSDAQVRADAYVDRIQNPPVQPPDPPALYTVNNEDGTQSDV